jgi:hypothetical protein
MEAPVLIYVKSEVRDGGRLHLILRDANCHEELDHSLPGGHARFKVCSTFVERDALLWR